MKARTLVALLLIAIVCSCIIPNAFSSGQEKCNSMVEDLERQLQEAKDRLAGLTTALSQLVDDLEKAIREHEENKAKQQGVIQQQLELIARMKKTLNDLRESNEESEETVQQLLQILLNIEQLLLQRMGDLGTNVQIETLRQMIEALKEKIDDMKKAINSIKSDLDTARRAYEERRQVTEAEMANLQLQLDIIKKQLEEKLLELDSLAYEMSYLKGKMKAIEAECDETAKGIDFSDILAEMEALRLLVKETNRLHEEGELKTEHQVKFLSAIDGVKKKLKETMDKLTKGNLNDYNKCMKRLALAKENYFQVYKKHSHVESEIQKLKDKMDSLKKLIEGLGNCDK